MKHINEFKLNENVLTPEQTEAIKYAKEHDYKFIGTEKINGQICVVVDNNGDEIYIYPDGTDIQGLNIRKSIEGYWVDPAGGVHSPDRDGDFYDPASMYENLKHLKKFKLNG